MDKILLFIINTLYTCNSVFLDISNTSPLCLQASVPRVDVNEYCTKDDGYLISIWLNDSLNDSVICSTSETEFLGYMSLPREKE